MVIDPQQGNVYQIGYQYLGFGNAHFSVEDEDTGSFPVTIQRGMRLLERRLLCCPHWSIVVLETCLGFSKQESFLRWRFLSREL